MATDDPRLVYADSSALVKLVVAERESHVLRHHLRGDVRLVSSAVAIVEVPRAVALANPSPAALADAWRQLDGTVLLQLDDERLRRAAAMRPPRLRALDAIHLACAIEVAPDEFVAYDRCLLDAAAQAGLAVLSPA